MLLNFNFQVRLFIPKKERNKEKKRLSRHYLKTKVKYVFG